jgi:hypothetical protein
MVPDIARLRAALPNREFFSGSQDEALRGIRELGIPNAIPASAATQPFIGVSDLCKTHWIVVRVVRGAAISEDNGIYVSCLPRSALSGEDLKKRILAVYGGTILEDREAR